MGLTRCYKTEVFFTFIPVYDEVRRRSIYENLQLFIRSKTDILNVTIFIYFLCAFGETILHRKYQLISHEISDHI